MGKIYFLELIYFQTCKCMSVSKYLREFKSIREYLFSFNVKAIYIARYELLKYT